MQRHRFKTVIDANHRPFFSTIAETWHRRDLIYYLVYRDLLIRYKQSLLGVGWALLQPISMMLIFTVVFSKIARVPSTEMPYPLLVFSAMLPWQLFATAINRGATSIVGNSNLVTKVYFPRIIIPLAAILVPLVDFGISWMFLLGLQIYYGFPPHASVCFLPLLALCVALVAGGISFWLTTVHVKYRDVGLLLPLALQFGMYATPVAYSSSLVPKAWLSVYQLNPLVQLVEGVRWATIGVGPAPSLKLAYSVFSCWLIFFAGLWYFMRMESNFTDDI